MKRKTIFILLGVAIVLVATSLVGFYLITKPDDSEWLPNEIIELDSIEKYGYVLEDRDSFLYKNTFENLSDVLMQEEIDYEEYAKLLSQLYIIDLYTINNKINQYDVGSTDFIKDEHKENFELNVKDTLYKYVEDNTYGKRVQELPEVSSITVKDMIKQNVRLADQEYEGYVVLLSWEYLKDLGYDNSAKVSLAKIDEKLYIINQSASS